MFLLQLRLLIFCGFVAIICSPAAISQEFQINGAPVSKKEYDAAMLFNSSRALMQEQKWSEAEGQLRQALELSPRLKPARNNLGIVLVRLGKYRDAINLLSALVEEDKSQAMAWATLGGAYMSEGEIEKSADAYRRFLTLKPDHKEAARYKDMVRGLELEQARRKQIGDTNSLDSYAKSTPTDAPKWASLTKPLKVFVPASSTASGYLPQYRNILIAGFKKWEQMSGGKVRFEFVEKLENADIDCQWSDDPNAAVFKAEGGHAHITGANGTIHKVNILLLTKGSASMPLNDFLIGKLSLHEIGHALGIVGHSENREDIMFYSIDVSQKEGQVSSRDVKTLSEIYK